MNIKSLSPFQHFTLSSSLPLEEIKKRLLDNCDTSISLINAPQGVRSLSGKPYGGEVTADGFEIFKVVYEKNLHLPVLKGKFDSYLGKTLIKVAVQPQLMSLAVFVVATIVIACMITMPGMFVNFLVVPFYFKVFGCVMLFLTFGRVIYSFNLERRSGQQFLTNLLEAERLDG